MTEPILLEAPEQPPIGTWPVTVTSLVMTDIETQEGTKTLLRWGFAIEAEGHTYETDALSSLAFGPRAKARKWCTALGVTAEKVSADMIVGREGLAVVVEDGDYRKIDDVVAPIKKTP